MNACASQFLCLSSSAKNLNGKQWPMCPATMNKLPASHSIQQKPTIERDVCVCAEVDSVQIDSAPALLTQSYHGNEKTDQIDVRSTTSTAFFVPISLAIKI